MYKVYKHTAPNGKVYIGITNQKPERRWGKNGQGYKENDYFYKAIKKHGWQNFKHEILADGLTEEEACLMEIRLIEEYKSTDRNYGYNRHAGGKVHDTICRDDLLDGNFKSYKEIKNSPSLYQVFKNLISSALGFEYVEETKTTILKNGKIKKVETITETKTAKPSYFAICFLLKHYSTAKEVKEILPTLNLLKLEIEKDF